MHRDENHRDEKPHEPSPAGTDFNTVFAKELGKQPDDWLDGMKECRLVNYGIKQEQIMAMAQELDTLLALIDIPEISCEALYAQWEKTAQLLHATRHESRYTRIAEQMSEVLIARYGATSWRIRDFLQYAYRAAKKTDFREARLEIAEMVVASLTTKDALQQWGDHDKAEVAECLLALGRQDEALNYVEQAWSYALADEDSPKAYRCVMLAGDIAMRTGDFPKAANYFELVLQELTKRPRANSQAIANLKAKLGEVRVGNEDTRT
jgi:tetratricopeptide (TPR) repeat protein